jgi:hypothetical protein
MRATLRDAAGRGAGEARRGTGGKSICHFFAEALVFCADVAQDAARDLRFRLP